MKRHLGWLIVVFSGAAFAQTPNAPVLRIGGGFFTDPFASYPCYVADTRFSGTNGTSTTVSWNSTTITAPTYSTIDAAVNAAAAAGPGHRVCLLAGETYIRSGTPVTIPSYSGATVNNRFVIQGDPAASSGTMPIISGNGGPGGGIAIGSYPGASSGFNNQFVTIRKVEITNFQDSSGSAVYGIALSTFNGGTFNGAIIEYCKMHLFRVAVGPGGSGPIYAPNPGVTDSFEVRYSKGYDTLMTDGTTQGRPFSFVNIYGGVFNIHHNESYGSYTFVHFKVLPNAAPNGSVYKNLIHDTTQAFNFEAGGEANGTNGIAFYGNLFYWTNYNNSVFGTPGSAEAYNDSGSQANTTAPTNVQFYNNTLVQALGSSGAPAFWNINTSNVQFYNNVVLGTAPLAVKESQGAGTFSLCDYNVYFNPSVFYLNLYGSPQSVGSFGAWRTAHSSNPSFAGLSADPDAHGLNIAALAAPWNTITAHFPNAANNDYTIASGSPLLGSGQGGATPGYNSSDVGPGW